VGDWLLMVVARWGRPVSVVEQLLLAVPARGQPATVGSW